MTPNPIRRLILWVGLVLSRVGLIEYRRMHRITELAWPRIVDGLDVRPLPAGHTPGAASFLFRIDDGETHRTVLATGDFTVRRAAGYPGFDPTLPIDVDVCLLSATSDEAFGHRVTEAIATVYERARAGSPTLVTAGGLLGVQFAYLLGQFASSHARVIPIQLVGQTAILAERLEYDIPGGTPIAEFTDPTAVLDPGRVTIAGPDVPTGASQTSAARLFDVIEDDPAATLVQFPAGGGKPIRAASCTVHEFALRNHPTPTTIERVIESLSPTHVVILHETSPDVERYKHRNDCYVWITDDAQRHTLVDGTGVTPPPWVSQQVVHTVMQSQSSDSTGQRLDDGIATDGAGDLVPALERSAPPDLVAEGVFLDQLPNSWSTTANEPSQSKYDPAQSSLTSSETEMSSPSIAACLDTNASSSAVVELLVSIDERLARVEAAIDQRQ